MSFLEKVFDIKLNDTMLTVSKPNKCETWQQKIATLLTNEKHVLAGNYFYTHVSHLLEFDTDDVVSLDTKYFFVIRPYLKRGKFNFSHLFKFNKIMFGIYYKLMI